MRKKLKIKKFGKAHFYIDNSNDTYTDEYSVNSLSDIFNESIRMECNVFDKISPVKFYEKNRDDIIDAVNKKYNVNKISTKLFTHYVREKIYELHPFECTPFNPSLYSCIIEMASKILDTNKLCILDPSCGWGDRLISVLSSKFIKEYNGCDPNEKLYPGYLNIIKTIGKISDYKINENYVNVIKNKYTEIKCNTSNININIQCLPFEKSGFELSKYDLVCTSPPYFNAETYSNDITQSIMSNKTEKDWFNQFLCVLIDKSSEYLKPGGLLILHISQHKRHHYIEWMIKKKYKNLISLGIFGCKGESNKIFPLFVWRKKGVKNIIDIKK